MSTEPETEQTGRQDLLVVSTESETVDRTDKKTGSVVVSTEPETVDRTNSKINGKTGYIGGEYRTRDSRQDKQQDKQEERIYLW